jgi:hypothetical protein
MPKIAPPPPTNQDVSSRAYRDWFYSLYAALGTPGATLGTMAYEDANNVAITGGSIGGVGITGSTINSTPVGNTNPSTGAFTNLSSSGTVSGTGFTNLFASPPPLGSTTPNTVNSTGGALNGSIGVTTPNEGHFTSNLTRDGYTVKPNCYIEAYDLSTTIALTSTPTILAPANTVAGSTGITYNSSTGVFTFAEEGDYSLSLSVNATSTAANQFLYIYAQNNTGSGWVNNTNSGKFYSLTNGQTVQIVYSQSVHRVAGQQVRYYIYSNDGHVSLGTQTLPTVTPSVYVPAIRIQYS